MERARAPRSESRPDPDVSFSGPASGAVRSSESAETISEAEAQRVWQAAARLQAEAARRLDARSKVLAEEHRAAPVEAAAFTRAEVAEIAQAAGIDPSYVELAWREVEAEHARATTVSDARHDRASAFLGTDAERLTVTRTFRADPEDVLAAMERVFTADPYRLKLAEVLGDSDALTDSVLVFDVPQVDAMSSVSGGYTAFSYAMTIADLTRAVVTLHPLGDGRTEATMAVDLRHGKARNFTVGAWLTGLGATVAALVGGVAGLALGDGGAGAVLGAGIAGSGGGGLSWLAYRAAYRAGLRKGKGALEDLLKAVDVNLRTGGAFAPTPSPPRTSGGGPLSSILSDL